MQAKGNAITNPTILITAAVYAVLLRVAIFAGLFGMVLLILLLLSLSRYAYSVLHDVAHERLLRPPAVETMNWIGELGPTLHSIFYLLAVGFLATTPLFEGIVANLVRWLAFGALLAGFPASAAEMAISGDMGAAFNLRELVRVIGIMGNRYWTLLATCIGLGLLYVFSRTVLAHMGLLLVLLVDFITVWVFLALFAAIGSAIGEFRREFELRGEPEMRQEEQQRYVEQQRQRYLDRAYTSIRSGLLAQGFRPIQELVTAEGQSIEIYQWLFDRMVVWDDPKPALIVAERLVESLIDARRHGNALDLVQKCQQLSSEFVPSPVSINALVKYARGNGWHHVADELDALPSKKG